MTEPPTQPTWRQKLKRRWGRLLDWWPRSPTTDDFASCCFEGATGCCTLVVAIIPATVIVTWSLLGPLIALVVWPAALLFAHAVRYATGTQHRYPRSLVEDLRLTLEDGQHRGIPCRRPSHE